MSYNLIFLCLFVACELAECKLEPFITGGSFIEYTQYPHSILLVVVCHENAYICGGSVLNQKLVLTAAHCLEDCTRKSKVQVKYGHKTISKMKKTMMKSFMIHKKYDQNTIHNDIGMLLTKDRLPLNDVVKRVILMKSPPKVEYAYVAGWGIDEYDALPNHLKHTHALIQSASICRKMGTLAKGVFCAGPITAIGAADEGDSGSALVVNRHIQIGIVSFKVQSYRLVAYTNVSFYLGWIYQTAKQLYCSN